LLLKELTAKFSFSLSGDFELRLLRNIGTIEVLGTLGDGLKAFCTMKWI
jgi:hypothetical protein